MPDDWKKKIIHERIEAVHMEERREFAIAYAALPAKYHGYLSALPQNQKVFSKQHLLEEETYRAWSKEYPELRQWDAGVFVEKNQPFFGVDGYLAYATDLAYEHKTKFSIVIETNQVSPANNMIIVRAKVTFGDTYAEGVAAYAPGSKDDIEIITSKAVRKAFSYLLPVGRFPVYKTPYGEDTNIAEYRKFLQEKAGNVDE